VTTNSIATKTKTVAMRLATSTVVLLIVFFVAAEIVIRETRPLRMFNHTGLTSINQNFLVSKLPPCLSSHENPEVLLLGSSLVLVPSVRCDDSFHNRKTRFDRWYYRNVIDEYTKADFFQNALTKASSQNRKVLDLAIAASIMSDQHLILKKYLASGKKPELIVCGIAPRDFLDNLRQDPEKTPTYSILADLTCVKDLLEQKRSKEAISNFAFGYLSDVFKNRADYKTFLVGAASRISGHPVDLYNATLDQEKSAEPTTGMAVVAEKADRGVLDNSKPLYKEPKNTLSDLKEYNRIYLPVNNNVFKLQLGYLDKFLALATEHNIPVVLVEMPLTAENLAILPDDVRRRYSKKVQELATRYNAKIVTPGERMTFATDDFEDSVHLNTQGGLKVFSDVAQQIGNDRALAQRTGRNKTTLGSLPIQWPF